MNDCHNIDMNTLPMGIARIAFDGRAISLMYANDYLYKILSVEKGYQFSEWTRATEIFPDLTEKSVHVLYHELAEKKQLTTPLKIVNKHSTELTIDASFLVIERNDRVLICDVCLREISQFLSELIKKETLYDRKLTHDALTGLPKSSIFAQKCREYIEESEQGDCFASVYIDINNFKLINEKIGRKNGDGILLDLCGKLSELCEDRGYLMRAFSDKYLLFLKIDEESSLKNEIEHFIDDFTKIQHDKHPDCNITMGAGICTLGSLDFSITVDYAAIAHKKAKMINENNCVIFDEQMKTEINRAMDITNEAEQAIIRRNFVVYYQPKISLKLNKVIGAEALVRWKKDDGTLIPPGLFIPYLEKTSFITKVDFYVYEETCRFLRKRIDSKAELVPISVNFSRLHLNDSGFIDNVITMADKYDVPHRYIDLELTESAYLEDEKVAVQTFGTLRKHGFLISIDDFGSGYSSLNLLKILPVDTLKMDKGFFGNANLSDGGNDAILVSGIIDMVNKMNINIVCEGVETQEQIEFLKKTDCCSIQGFYYAKPMPEEDFEAYIAKFNHDSNPS